MDNRNSWTPFFTSRHYRLYYSYCTPSGTALRPILAASRKGLHTILPENELDLPVHVLVVDGLALLKVDPTPNLPDMAKDVIQYRAPQIWSINAPGTVSRRIVFAANRPKCPPCPGCDSALGTHLPRCCSAPALSLPRT